MEHAHLTDRLRKTANSDAASRDRRNHGQNDGLLDLRFALNASLTFKDPRLQPGCCGRSRFSKESRLQSGFSAGAARVSPLETRRPLRGAAEG